MILAWYLFRNGTRCKETSEFYLSRETRVPVPREFKFHCLPKNGRDTELFSTSAISDVSLRQEQWYAIYKKKKKKKKSDTIYVKRLLS